MPQMGRSMVPRRGLNRLVVADADPPKIRAFGPGQNGCLARGPRQEPNRHMVAEVFRRVMPAGYDPMVVLLCNMELWKKKPG